MHIALLEDDTDFVECLRLQFKDKHNLAVSDSVKDLVGYIKSEKDNIDCVLLDIHLHGMELGLDAGAMICKDPMLPYIPVFFHTGVKPSNMDLSICIEKKAKFDFVELIARIEEVKNTLDNHWFKITSYLDIMNLIETKYE